MKQLKFSYKFYVSRECNSRVIILDGSFVCLIDDKVTEAEIREITDQQRDRVMDELEKSNEKSNDEYLAFDKYCLRKDSIVGFSIKAKIKEEDSKKPVDAAQ